MSAISSRLSEGVSGVRSNSRLGARVRLDRSIPHPVPPLRRRLRFSSSRRRLCKRKKNTDILATNIKDFHYGYSSKYLKRARLVGVVKELYLHWLDCALCFACYHVVNVKLNSYFYKTTKPKEREL